MIYFVVGAVFSLGWLVGWFAGARHGHKIGVIEGRKAGKYWSSWSADADKLTEEL